MLRGRELSTDFNTVTISRSAETPDSTCFKSTTRTRMEGGVKDWTVGLGGLFNDETGAAEERAHTLLAGSTILGIWPHNYTTACNLGYEGESVEPDYSVEAPVEGIVTLSSTWSGSGDIYRTHILKTLSACSTAGSASGSTRDYSASGDVVGVLRCTAASGTSPTLDAIIQHSGDDSAWTDLIAFTQMTAGSGCELKSGSVSGSRYLRAKWTLAGTGEDFEFMVTAGRT